ncbi:hypothetical protein Q3G72_021677 [Acer saccharum]|nr:hypothetical protein Q3G72_021677 [Acer saccharum]
MAAETQEISAESSTIDVYHLDTTILVQQQQAEPGSNTDTTIHIYHYDSALHIFNSMPRRSSVSYNAMMSGYLQTQEISTESLTIDVYHLDTTISVQQQQAEPGSNTDTTIHVYHYDSALHIFNSMTCQSSVSYNAMMSGYLCNDDFDLVMLKVVK